MVLVENSASKKLDDISIYVGKPILERSTRSTAPKLVVEVLSPGANNEKRDRDLKLRLYFAWGVHEYWLVNWQLQQLEVYRREEGKLSLSVTLLAEDVITSPLFPDFSCSVALFFD